MRYFGSNTNESATSLDGNGVCHLIEQEILYKGDMKNNQFNGKGTLFVVDGSESTGEFKDGNLNGEHIVTDGNGHVFQRFYVEN